jgi:hypothetical protein
LKVRPRAIDSSLLVLEYWVTSESPT